MVDTPTLGTVIRQAIEEELVELHTAIPGKVQTFNAASQVADIVPQFKRVIREADGTRAPETLPVIPSVPVLFPRAGAFFFSFPIVSGTTGLIILAEYSIDRWRQGGEQADPGDTRRHGLSGAVFLPGLSVAADTIGDFDPARMVFGVDGSNGIDLDAAFTRLGMAAATEGIGLGTALQSFLATLKTYLDTHVHTGVTTGGGSSGPPAAPSPAAPTVASSKHLVEP